MGENSKKSLKNEVKALQSEVQSWDQDSREDHSREDKTGERKTTFLPHVGWLLGKQENHSELNSLEGVK